MRSALRRLEELEIATAPPTSESREALLQRRQRERERASRLGQLSPYKQCEFHCLESVQTLRDALRECEELSSALSALEGEGNSTANRTGDEIDGKKKVQLKASDQNRRATLQLQLARSRQAARRAHRQLQKLQRESQLLSSTASANDSTKGSNGNDNDSTCETDFRSLNRHIERAKQWYRHEFNITVVSSLDDPLLHPSSTAREGAPLLEQDDRWTAGNMAEDDVARGRCQDARLQHLFSNQKSNRSCGDSGGADASREDAESGASNAIEYRNARDDAEFQQFFLSVKQNDNLMDEALERISAAVHRLHVNALGMTDELALQSTLLDQTEVRIERNQEDLRRINRRLGHAIREMDESSVCSYVLCLLALLLVLAVLVKVLG